MTYEFLEHTADIKFRAKGKSIEEVFKESAMALKETMTKGTEIKKIEEKDVGVEGKDYESMLRNFLEEFLFLFDAEDFILSDVTEVMIDGFRLVATVKGDIIDNYKLTNDVKAITYNEMYVKETEKGWEAQVVLDV
ncbi:archease [Candidatus Woesearchaeota archaeon]|jgi:SHS2 domain-containing protein|nr:archease [Candidatus Woesearchaeota archaeon]MBT4368165.1 archease [Candidatus Woesearchaeota archaeon]MBT4712653.1 archease [Candidatus Woesearchaeota archaeon]MBT6639566.1 archease [Candidatus Woesearchaeota archaeon]MBT7133738.1 archease [Candidatus Woesearchaeota archaeon]